MQVNKIDMMNFKALNISRLGKYEKKGISKLIPELEKMAEKEDIELSTVSSSFCDKFKVLKIKISPLKKDLAKYNKITLYDLIKTQCYDPSRLIDAGKNGKTYDRIFTLIDSVRKSL